MRSGSLAVGFGVFVLTATQSAFAELTPSQYTSWKAAANAVPSHVVVDTNSDAGYTFAGAGITYDYGALNSSSTATNPGDGATFEFIVNATKVQNSTALAGFTGFGGEVDIFKLEQWQDTGVFGTTRPGVADFNFNSSASIFSQDVHVVLVNTSDGSFRLYVNGIDKGIDTAPSAYWAANGFSGVLGSGNGVSSDPVTGRIYAVGTYSTALTADQITTLYNAFSSPVPEPATLGASLFVGAGALLRRRAVRK